MRITLFGEPGGSALLFAKLVRNLRPLASPMELLRSVRLAAAAGLVLLGALIGIAVLWPASNEPVGVLESEHEWNVALEENMRPARVLPLGHRAPSLLESARPWLGMATEASKQTLIFKDIKAGTTLVWRNRSLGLNHEGYRDVCHEVIEGNLSHTTRKLKFTPNRPVPVQHDTRSAIVVAVMGERYEDGLAAVMDSWQRFLLGPEPSKSYVMVVVLLEGTEASVDAFAGTISSSIDVLDCNTKHNRAFCAQLDSLDNGYRVFVAKESGMHVWVTYEPAFIPPVFGEDSKLSFEKFAEVQKTRCKNCCYFALQYTYATNWYGFGLPFLQVMDYFDFAFKIDTDLMACGPAPLEMVDEMVRSHAPYMTCKIGADRSCGGRNKDVLFLFLDQEEKHCGSRFQAQAEKRVWWDISLLVPEANFFGFWLGLTTSPEVSRFAITYRDFKEGLREQRWGDQQFWSNIWGLFFPDAYKQHAFDVKEWRSSGLIQHKRPCPLNSSVAGSAGQS
ncbi:hypothetical protein FVE85_4220 [Porphyridium purpureum]|uniref:Uncharacterized protein n=1 Tax=Porphyridium purpureum TaxID=35688 RepID=A0A5J4YSQ9_PORPP|nr:hypothetical protein FVE85_4220 [Porphyridium purpureum]|eukprot:POR0978..scf229_5